MSDRDTNLVVYSLTTHLFLNILYFWIGLLFLGFAFISFIAIFTSPWDGFKNGIVSLLLPFISAYLAYRFLTPTFSLIKRWVIDPMINLYRFIKKLIQKIAN